RAEQGDGRGAGGELRLDDLRATEDRGGHHDPVGDVDVDVVGEHRLVELHRQTGGDVAAVVGGAGENGVGSVAALDGRGQRGSHVDALELAAQVAGGQHLGCSVLADDLGDSGAVAAGEAL